MDSWLWFWTSDVERCLIWVAALVLPQQDILSASICIFHHAFLDDQTPLTSPTFLCVDLLDYSCFFTTLNTGISKLRYRQVRTAAKSTPETCQIHSKQRKRTVTLKGHQNRDLPSKGFSSSDVFRALSSELLFILESKKKALPLSGGRPKQQRNHKSFTLWKRTMGGCTEGRMHGPAVHALSKWQSPMHHQPPTTMQRPQLIENGANNTKAVGFITYGPFP